jgi:hypothetical protein
MGSQYPEVKIIVEDIHKYKFVSSIYMGGTLVTKCKIWVGGPVSGNAISYSSGTHIDINNDNSCNDSLYVDEKEGELGLKASMRMFGVAASEEFDGVLSAEKAAQYLWLRATEELSHR